MATIVPKPSALQEILVWSQSADRPEWQRDALRRIISGKLAPTDIDELEMLCRAKHGALDEGETAPVASTLQAAHIPTESGHDNSISLVSLGNLQNVNRLSSEETLAFGTAPGLTIIYGDNGAGKSGYARVIKKACRIRGQADPIEPNAYAKTACSKATAQFTIRDNTGNQPPINWQDGTEADIRLGQVFLFDSACADHYVRADDGTTFTPFGLDILDKLSRQLCDPIKTKIDGRTATLNSAIDAAKNGWKYKPDTAVGKLLNGLSAKTKETEIDAVAIWSDADNTRLSELRAALASDPKIKSEQTRAAAQRVRKFRQAVAITSRTLSVGAVSALHAAVDEAQEARKTAQELAVGKFDETFLPGTGGAIWKKLWQAAREYSAQSAYAGQNFPVIDDGARCVLCQSDLDVDAKARLQQFDDYIQNTASQLAVQKESHADKLAQKFSGLGKIFNEKTKVEADLAGVDEQTKAAIDAYVSAADTRLSAILDALKNNQWGNIPPLAAYISHTIRTLEKTLLQQAATEASAADPEARKKMENERDALDDRQRLFGAKASVKSQIKRYAQIERLKKCAKDVGTRPITDKNKELTEKFVTKAFCEQFEVETKKLGLRTLKVKLHPVQGAKGVTKFGVRLQDAEASVLKIASEGERGCIALALFLAELSQASHASTLVFDDPVSSLDHLHKEKTAQRLVEEGLGRQVIVFTHDTVLLHELQTAATEKGITPHAMYLEWNGGVPGHCVTGLPWDWKSAADRFDRLEKEQKSIAASWNPTPNEANKRAMREAYSWLRATFERMVESTVFSDSVIRFRKEVKVGRLSDVVGFSQPEFDELERLHKRCCNITEAHDHAQAQNAAVPTPHELAQDIADGKKLLETIRTRQKQVKDATKQAAVAA